MLSRIAESLYWMSRYVERTDGLLRILHTNYILSLDKGGYGFSSWKPVLEIFSNSNNEKLHLLESNTNDTLQYLLLDATNVNSMKCIINRSRENARGAQDHITKEVWEHINHIYHLINNPATKTQLLSNDSMDILDQLMENATLYNGVTDSTMPRNLGWSFMTIGKFVERCLMTLEVMDKHFAAVEYSLDDGKDILYWRNLLLSLSGYEFYLKTNNSSNHNLNVAKQVLFSKQFTRSVNYCMDRIGFYLQKVVEENKPEGAEQLLKQFGRTHSSIEFCDEALLRKKGTQQTIKELKSDLLLCSHLMEKSFFSYT